MYWEQIFYNGAIVLEINGYEITAGPTTEEFKNTSGYEDEYRIYVVSKEMTDPIDGHKHKKFVWKGHEFKDTFYEHFFRIVRLLKKDPDYNDVRDMVNPHCIY